MLRVELLGSNLVRRSTLLFMSNVVVRLLGLGFSVIVARTLAPSGYGVVTYVLALANLSSILLFNAASGLARALARAHDDRAEQTAAFSNYVIVVAGLLLLSLLAGIPIGLVGGLQGWLLVGLLSNLLGNALYQIYIEVHRGRERFLAVAGYTLLANLIQLLTVGSMSLLGWRQPAAYVIVFGLSGIPALLIIERLVPAGLEFVRTAVERQRMREVIRFVFPLLLHTIFFMVWTGADVVFLKVFGGLSAVGEYGVAKTLANAMLLAPAAITVALLPRAARLESDDRGEYFRKLILLVGAAMVPPVAVLAIGGRLILHYVYGPNYEAAALPLLILAAGTGLYGIEMTLEESWIAMGHPRLAAGVTILAAAITVITAPLLVMHAGATGAAVAYSLGAVGQLAFLVVVTFRFLLR